MTLKVLLSARRCQGQKRVVRLVQSTFPRCRRCRLARYCHANATRLAHRETHRSWGTVNSFPWLWKRCLQFRHGNTCSITYPWAYVSRGHKSASGNHVAALSVRSIQGIKRPVEVSRTSCHERYADAGSAMPYGERHGRENAIPSSPPRTHVFRLANEDQG